MLELKNLLRRFAAFGAAWLLVLGIAIPVVVPSHAKAALVTSRSLSLSSSANGTVSTDAGGNAVNPGAGGNGVKAKHTVKFNLGTSGGTVGSITIMYCTSPVLQSTCTTPTGLDASHIAAGNFSITGLSGSQAFSLDTTTNSSALSPSADGVCNGSGTTRTNCVAMKRASAVAETGTPTATITYGGGASDYITNPTSDNYSFYARILVFSDTAYTTLLDYGGVAASTAQQIDITAKVAERLDFSVGTTVTAPSTNCAPFTDTGALILGDVNGVLSTGQAYANHSYFRVDSNSVGGTTIYYSGDTLKSGASSITAAGTTAVASTVGSKQFGLALDSSDTQSGSGYSFTDLTASTSPTNYGAGNGTITNGGTALFGFDTNSTTSPVKIASSASGISCDTGSVRYIANISTNTPAGIYTTTITYIATAVY